MRQLISTENIEMQEVPNIPNIPKINETDEKPVEPNSMTTEASNMIDSDSDSDSDISETESEEPISSGNETYVHPITHKAYTLMVEKHLQKDTTDLDKDIEYTIYLCMYKVILNSQLPYLLYYSVKNATTNKLEFPSYKFNIGAIDSPLTKETVLEKTGGATESNQMEAEFEDQLLQKIRGYIQGNESLDIEPFYRGFYMIPSLTEKPVSELVVFIDITNIPAHSPEFIHITPYEMFASKQCNGIEISESMTQPFLDIYKRENTKDMNHLYDSEKGGYVETPYCLYLCKKDAMGNYVSVDNKTPAMNALLFGRINHETFGNQLIFSNRPQGMLFSSSENLRRFLVFSPNSTTAFIENELTKENVFDDDAKNYSAISFLEGANQLWAIGSLMIVESI